MRLTRIDLNNYRCFQHLHVDFHHRLTVLVAPNGYGKSAVLDAVAVALGPFVGAFDEGKDRTFSVDDIRLVRPSDGSNTMEFSADGISLEAGAVFVEQASIRPDQDQDVQTWSRSLAGPKARTTRKNARNLTHHGKRLQELVRKEADTAGTSVVLPLVGYYDTGRLWNIRRLPYRKMSRTSRMVGYTHSLEAGSDFHLFADWFRYWSVNVWKARIDASQRGILSEAPPFENAVLTVRTALNECLSPAGWRDLDFSMAREELVAVHPEFGELPVAMLSDGVRSMLALVGDIAFRAVKLNPHLGQSAIRDTPGIVLVDEVDMHLHPGWQQLVLGKLLDVFPGLQFIVTTHSPQVLSTVKKEHIRILGKNIHGQFVAEAPRSSSYGEFSGDVLESIMAVNAMPPIKELEDLQRLVALVDQGSYDTEEALRLRQKLAKALGSNHPQIRKMERSIARQKALTP